MSYDVNTGHPGIDRQHHLLAELIDRLGTVCEVERCTGSSCSLCDHDYHNVCNERLATLIGELLGFMVEHFAFEEQLMRLLPDTEECRAHVEGHRFAHAEVSRQMSELTEDLDRLCPRESSAQLQTIIHAWLGQHALSHDTTLASSLGHDIHAELDYDTELSKLLGR